MGKPISSHGDKNAGPHAKQAETCPERDQIPCCLTFGERIHNATEEDRFRQLNQTEGDVGHD
jgi:hypothetical protein